MGWTITEMKEINQEKGYYFFERDTMRFFRSKIETAANDAGIFVTSEQPPDGARKYTLRLFDHITGNVETVGEFMQYTHREDALLARRFHSQGRV